MTLTVVMTTYAPVPERAAYAREVVTSLMDSLIGPWNKEPINFIIADDGSPQEIKSEFYYPLQRDLTYKWNRSCNITNSFRSGIGGSLNHALGLVDDLWLYVTDDWVLEQRLLITPALRLIRDMGYDYVRINPLHPNLRCVTQHHNGMWWLHLDRTHPDGGFYFATRPFIATKRFYNRVGPFKEYADAYDTEQDYSDRVNAYNSLLPMAALVDMHGGWSHIGEYPVGRIQLERPAGV